MCEVIDPPVWAVNRGIAVEGMMFELEEGDDTPPDDTSPDDKPGLSAVEKPTKASQKKKKTSKRPALKIVK